MWIQKWPRDGHLSIGMEMPANEPKPAYGVTLNQSINLAAAADNDASWELRQHLP